MGFEISSASHEIIKVYAIYQCQSGELNDNYYPYYLIIIKEYSKYNCIVKWLDRALIFTILFRKCTWKNNNMCV